MLVYIVLHRQSTLGTTNVTPKFCTVYGELKGRI